MNKKIIKIISKSLLLLCLFSSVSCGNSNNEVISNPLGIVSIEKTGTTGNIDIFTITYSDGNKTTFTVTNGTQGIQGIQGETGKDGHTPVITIDPTTKNWVIDGVNTNISSQGVKGETGNGIVSIAYTKTDGNVDTYTITYTDGRTTTFTVSNGINGEKGIQGEAGKDGHTPVITIDPTTKNWVIDGVNTNISSQGSKGETGNGIVSIQLNRSEGNVDIYTIVYSNGETTSFSVTNGSNGEQGIQGEPGKDGHTPVITIGQNGHWLIDGVDTGFNSQGNQGAVGLSAYDLYIKNHPEYTKSESEWIEDLVNGRLGDGNTIPNYDKELVFDDLINIIDNSNPTKCKTDFIYFVDTYKVNLQYSSVLTIENKDNLICASYDYSYQKLNPIGSDSLTTTYSNTVYQKGSSIGQIVNGNIEWNNAIESSISILNMTLKESFIDEATYTKNKAILSVNDSYINYLFNGSYNASDLTMTIYVSNDKATITKVILEFVTSEGNKVYMTCVYTYYNEVVNFPVN